MPFTYKPLWKLLIEKGMTKTELRQELGISQVTIAKMSKGKHVSLDVLDKICGYFYCQIEELIEHTLGERVKNSVNASLN